jgi:hypothetical protein
VDFRQVTSEAGIARAALAQASFPKRLKSHSDFEKGHMASRMPLQRRGPARWNR